jgi:hypothetical protein
MEYKTYLQMKTKVKKDLDLEDETFISDAEMLGYFNEAIDEAESDILGLAEDYFLTKDTIDLVSGTAEYDLPTDIYANKIRGLIYSKDNLVYKIQRVRELDKFEEIGLILDNPNMDATFQFLVTNPAGDTPKIVFYPTPPSNAAGAITIWYIRNATRLTGDTDECDIPEFTRFVEQFVKVKCYEKEGHPNLQLAMASLERYRAQMVPTLREMVPDNDNEVEQNYDPYTEMN